MRLIYYLMVFVLFLILKRIYIWRTENKETAGSELEEQKKKDELKQNQRTAAPGQYIRNNTGTGSSNSGSSNTGNTGGSTGAGTTRRSY